MMGTVWDTKKQPQRGCQRPINLPPPDTRIDETISSTNDDVKTKET